MNSKFLRGFGVAAALLIPAAGLTVAASTAGAAGTLSATVGAFSVSCTGGSGGHYNNCHTTAGSGSLAAHVTIGSGSATILITTVPNTTGFCSVSIAATIPTGTSNTTITNAVGAFWSDSPTGCSQLTTGDVIHVVRS